MWSMKNQADDVRHATEWKGSIFLQSRVMGSYWVQCYPRPATTHEDDCLLHPTRWEAERKCIMMLFHLSPNLGVIFIIAFSVQGAYIPCKQEWRKSDSPHSDRIGRVQNCPFSSLNWTKMFPPLSPHLFFTPPLLVWTKSTYTRTLTWKRWFA